jgi:hypothetical protein
MTTLKDLHEIIGELFVLAKMLGRENEALREEVKLLTPKEEEKLDEVGIELPREAKDQEDST